MNLIKEIRKLQLEGKFSELLELLRQHLKGITSSRATSLFVEIGCKVRGVECRLYFNIGEEAKDFGWISFYSDERMSEPLESLEEVFQDIFNPTEKELKFAFDLGYFGEGEDLVKFLEEVTA